MAGRRTRASVEGAPPAPEPVTTRTVDPGALQVALGIAGGDRKRLVISNDGKSITVRNQPTRP